MTVSITLKWVADLGTWLRTSIGSMQREWAPTCYHVDFFSPSTIHNSYSSKLRVFIWLDIHKISLLMYI
jgi:hypothetical protein